MKVICLISHEQPGAEPGKFKQYEVGIEYDLEKYEDKLFKPVIKDKNKKLKLEVKNAD